MRKAYTLKVVKNDLGFFEDDFMVEIQVPGYDLTPMIGWYGENYLKCLLPPEVMKQIILQATITRTVLTEILPASDDRVPYIYMDEGYLVAVLDLIDGYCFPKDMPGMKLGYDVVARVCYIEKCAEEVRRNHEKYLSGFQRHPRERMREWLEELGKPTENSNVDDGRNDY